MLRQDWTAWLVAVPGKPPRFTASVLEPRFGVGGDDEWLPVLRLLPYAPRQPPPTSVVQPPLFALEAAGA